MAEVDLSKMGEKEEEKVIPRTPIQEIDKCLKACGFGLFNVKFLCIALIGFVGGTSVSNTTSYLLPIAECDLNMNLLQKGLLNAVPYCGMIFSSVLAGFLTDTFGRKTFVIFGFGGIFLCLIVAGSSQSYEVLVTAKFCEGLVFATAFSAAISLTAEFCHNGIRDRILILQSSFAAVSQLVIAGISWGVLTQDWKVSLFNGGFVINIWNIYLYIMSLWSLTAAILYSFLPESPKYLVIHKKYAEAREIMAKIYQENTGKPADTYPYKNIWSEEIKNYKDEALESKKMTLSREIVAGLHNVKPMFRKPLVNYLILICSTNFLAMALFNILRLWYPQVSTVVEHYNDGKSDLCDMLDAYTSDLKAKTLNTTVTECVPIISGAETYINSLIIGSTCLLPFLATGILVNKIGKKPLIIFAATICAATTMGLRWANSKTYVVMLFALDTAVGQTVMSLNQATIIEFFPTSSRTLAISIVMMVGRIGTLVGNIMFPILLNLKCEIPFFTLSGLMLCVAAMSFMLPIKK